MTNRKEIWQLRSKLAARGLNWSSWARQEGYEPGTVWVVVKRYWGADCSRPQGEISRAIIETLTKLESGDGFEIAPDSRQRRSMISRYKAATNSKTV